MWIPGLLLTILIVTAIVVVVVLAVRSPARPGNTGMVQTDAAGRVLDERLARGEINVEQYRELRSTLNDGRNR